MTGSELQSWATNLLNRNPTGTNLVRTNWGEDFPKQLLELCPGTGPGVHVYEEGHTPGGNGPPCVRVIWSSGFLGSRQFWIGATNFSIDTNSILFSHVRVHMWQTGVYFMR